MLVSGQDTTQEVEVSGEMENGDDQQTPEEVRVDGRQWSINWVGLGEW